MSTNLGQIHVSLWFRYPLHTPDETGVLGDIEPEDMKPPWQRGTERNAERKKEFEEAVSMASPDGAPTVAEIADFLGKSKSSVDRYVKDYGYKKTATEDGRWVVVKDEK